MEAGTGVNALTIVFAALCVFAIAYRFYGLFIASKVLNTLNANGIRYYMITSSEISISLTIEKKDKEKAVEVLGKAFDL